MVDFDSIPYIVLYKGGIDTEEQFNAMLEKDCGGDPEQQHAFLCRWLREWQQKNPLRLVLAELCDSDEIARFLCFAADYIEAFDDSAQNMMLDHSYHFGGKRVEAARSRLEAASLKGSSTAGQPAFSDVQEIEEDELPEIPEEPKTEPGQMFSLGQHRLICGDCTKLEMLERLSGGGKMQHALH
jgi:hypothetical protein